MNVFGPQFRLTHLPILYGGKIFWSLNTTLVDSYPIIEKKFDHIQNVKYPRNIAFGTELRFTINNLVLVLLIPTSWWSMPLHATIKHMVTITIFLTKCWRIWIYICTVYKAITCYYYNFGLKKRLIKIKTDNRDESSVYCWLISGRRDRRSGVHLTRKKDLSLCQHLYIKNRYIVNHTF